VKTGSLSWDELEIQQVVVIEEGIGILYRRGAETQRMIKKITYTSIKRVLDFFTAEAQRRRG